MGSCLAAGRRGAWGPQHNLPERAGASRQDRDIGQWGSTPSGIREDMQIIRGLLVLAHLRVSFISAFMALDMISLSLQQPGELGVPPNLRKRKLRLHVAVRSHPGLGDCSKESPGLSWFSAPAHAPGLGEGVRFLGAGPTAHQRGPALAPPRSCQSQNQRSRQGPASGPDQSASQVSGTQPNKRPPPGTSQQRAC